MLELFTLKDQLKNKENINQFPEIINVKQQYDIDIKKNLDYHFRTISKVDSPNYFVNILNTICPSFDNDIEDYIRIIENRLLSYASYFHINNSFKKARGHDRTININSMVFITSDSKLIYPKEIEQNWKILSPLTFLWHNGNSLNFNFENNFINNSNQTIQVYNLNLLELAVQYRSFVLYHTDKIDNTTHLNANHYVSMCLYPNSVRTKLELSIINRLISIFYKKKLNKITHNAPYIPDRTSSLDPILFKTIKYIKNRKLDYADMLYLFPSLSFNNGLEALQFPEMFETSNNKWVLLLSRLKLLVFMLDVGGKESLRRNRDLINKLQLTIERLNRNNIYQTMLPPNLYYEVNELLKKITNI